MGSSSDEYFILLEDLLEDLSSKGVDIDKLKIVPEEEDE